ncbi:exonuclease SbcCD subunit D C-terminal domain-containing protein [Coraliomargarita sp. SDUM461003]|uniref:Nuclease SbcCD subunit D n=1 Tax=Thalassobacterium maritimum TaxID=3041265 RepID=A0ABU1ASE2_9BACT|nr:exonuclease SbcCD subunit D C-terminal domain-containing protein [Coraliomargarita sp. SDUM461003]MDQ8207086.1 exonuclease SbcCD subunit D C-terminal domain-containing protein [Coraliomargarita sp. SDUM461003]
MKILHTADWHLGQNFFERDRLEEQSAFLDFLLQQIEIHAVDLLIIAGDLFDTANPPRAAEQLYFDFITRLHALKHCEAVIIGGNHDSAPHLDAPRTVLSKLNIHVIGSLPEALDDAVLSFERGGHRLRIAAVPFLRDRDVRRAIEGESFDEMEARTKAGILRTYQDLATQIEGTRQPGEVLLATGHLTAVGGRVSDSERSIHIGNLGSIRAEQFPSLFDYVALGHLHEPQAVGNCEHIRYSGSPIPLSFSESAHKEIRLLTLQDDQSLSQQGIPVPLARRLLRMEGSADTVLRAIDELIISGDELAPWIEVSLTEGDISPLINDQIRAAAADKQAVVLKVGRKLRASPMAPHPEQANKAISEWEPLAVFEKRIEDYAGDLNSDTLKQCFNHVLNAVQEEDV